MMRARRVLGLLLVDVAVAATLAAPATAQPAQTCSRPVVLVPDIASTSAALAPLGTAVERAGHCVLTAEYGSTPLSRAAHRAGGPRLGGLTSLEQSGSELARYLDSDAVPAGAVTVVAHGAGALAVQYALTHGVAASRIRVLITVGPIWNGTDIAGLADIEQISRRLGTFDTVLQLERPVVDPFCAACREIVTGSNFLVTLRRTNFPTLGVRYVDIVSRTDGLVTDPARSSAPGATVEVLQAADPASRSDHFGLPADRLVQSLVVAHVR